ncbi:2-oxoglutarate dehydrogenase complex dihydrolipoyllysine-residue succinyltransferase [Candidatus Deianiraea vastatrix]|uniref:Dihydrolipoyllysine-residue succinyltransferase component of 2-oxoglutarate dehydrogenase complex n=1 Tax=Candidatus Deianiraea vastatrix TaxID=2163644 RepID=A0A5B8XCY6_9RICK|nr:2-oxoglutarate dehydrogenase complex dihydrolipoyllysine-residue succinyltransferase [Candidatus Deianiraea vastatrix]QED22886.1 Dihydrolipoyllysine-residue succinyltransferase component of 2-oxoglutarate dehydrogenase complex [Candidatus Deianiraea vastatrix]
MINILTPTLGESVTEATIAKFHKKIGQAVKKDELIVEIETEKVMLEVCAASDGVIERYAFKEGDTVHAGDVIGAINPSGVASVAASDSAKENVASSDRNPSPSAQKAIHENNVSAKDINGTGRAGQVLKEDVLSYVINQSASSKPCEVAAKSDFTSSKSFERVKMTKLRQVIAKRLKDSQNTAAILTTFNEVDMSAVMELRNQYKEKFEKKYGAKLGFMSFFVKAAVAALREIPAINAEIDGADIIFKNFYDIGVAVGTENGLVVPVVRDCDKMSYAQIESKIVEYGKKARDGKLSVDEMQGGTFTISNGGVYGSLLSTPIINPPQSGILGLHNIVKRAVVVNDEIVIRPMMYIALSYDHRIVDGKEAVTFLVRIKELIEDPRRLVLDL